MGSPPVPADPPRCTSKGSSLEESTTLGQLDDLIYPYYKKDVESGNITRQDAAELLRCFWLKVRESEAYDPERTDMRHSQGSLLPDVTIGGRDEKGRDITSEATYLVLQVMRKLKVSEPAVYIRYHDGMKDDFCG